LLDAFKEFRGEIILLSEHVHDPSQYGIISGDIIDPGKGIVKIKDIVEKPEKPPSNMAVVGVYILSPKIFDALKKVKEDSSAVDSRFENSAGDGEGYAVLLKESEKRLDAGNSENYYRALVESYRFCMSNAHRVISE